MAQLSGSNSAGGEMVLDNKTGEALKAQRFQMLQDIAEELSSEIHFPTSFDLVIRLRETLRDPDWSLNQVATMLSVEPLISSRLVGMANSAAYNTGGTKVSDVKTAVMRLGLNIVRSTALGIATKQLMSSESMLVFSELSQRLWEHSLHTASAAYVISKRLTHFNPDEAMLAGMIHDIGAFYMLYRAAQYDELRSRPDTVKYLVTQWHEHIGYALLNAIGTPEDICEAVREHDHWRPIMDTPRNLTDIIYIANILAGGAFEWGYMDNTGEEQRIDCFDTKITDLSEEIDSYQTEITALFA